MAFFSPRQQLVHVEHLDRPPTFPYPHVPVDKGACRLLGPTALVVQALMGGLVVASLVFKRQREKPMRPWRIWLFDVSKQVLGQAFVHGLNLIISDHVAHVARGNPCDLYFLNILIDTTIGEAQHVHSRQRLDAVLLSWRKGVGYIYLVLHLADKLFTERLQLKGFRSGQYGDPPSIAFWGRQAAVYVFTILTMKLLLVGLFAAWPGILAIGEWLLSWTGQSDRLQVIFVMGIFPIIMNVLQFWLIDSIVKASASISTDPNDRVIDDSSRQPLFRAPDLDDDDDDDNTLHPQRRHDIESPPTPQSKSSQRINGNENKSLASTSSATLVEPSSMNSHSYPPERLPSALTTVAANPTPTSPPSASTTSSMSSLGSKRSRRRSPPPPIRRPPPDLSNSARYTISATPSPTVSRSTQRALSSYTTSSSPPKTQPRHRHRSTLTQGASNAEVSGEPVEQAWDNWAEGDDWAEKVEEENWTGRRVGVTKAVLDIWGSKGSTGASVEVS
ncbi:vacuolar membrane protein-domain-containing protein [Gautieria morchelliformis]|nr:vacuolar membrane protein-domain-containing protein [Gautieria morchelliformis]